jgi:hypothetical protein
MADPSLDHLNSIFSSDCATLVLSARRTASADTFAA